MQINHHHDSRSDCGDGGLPPTLGLKSVGIPTVPTALHLLKQQVYFFRYSIFETHVFHCIAPRFEFTALFRSLSYYVCLQHHNF